MKIVIAPDKFKDSLSAIQVCNALKKGIIKNFYEKDIISCPLADGGDGSLETLNYYLDLKPISLIVNDPLFRPIKSTYYLNNKTAYIELSSASGLVLLKEEDRNCMLTSSFGTGELICDALNKGIKNINLFIGGSATNDGGIGIASALGYKFYDASENLLSPIGKNLLLINRIDKSKVNFNFNDIAVKVICDVNNPLYGKSGAAYVYASQKGANSSQVQELDKGLVNLESKLLQYNFPSIADIPGAGAAGGVGGGSISFLNAKLISGIKNFLKISRLEKIIKDCDLVITGEGKLDSQTQYGKVISGVSNLAKKFNKSIIAVCGDADKGNYNILGLKKVYKILDKTDSKDNAMINAERYLVEIAEDISERLKKNYFY